MGNRRSCEPAPRGGGAAVAAAAIMSAQEPSEIYITEWQNSTGHHMGYRHSGGDVVEGGRVFELEKKVGGVRRGGGGGCVERDGGGSPGGLRHAWHGVGTRIVPVHRLARVAKGRSRTLHLGHINEYVLVSSDLGRRRLTGIETKFSEQSSTVRKAASRGKGGIWSVRVTAGKAHGGVQGVTARLQELTIGLSTSERKRANTVC